MVGADVNLVRAFHTLRAALLAAFAREACNHRKEIRAMNNQPFSQSEEIALRIDDTNLNHHLWDNNGTWWIHYTVYPTPVTAERIRHSPGQGKKGPFREPAGLPAQEGQGPRTGFSHDQLHG